jgi:hypothetical protein
MAALDSEDVKKAPKTKMGCVEEVGRDHIRYSLWEGETLLSRTKISHGPRHTIGDVLINRMTHQFKLGTNRNFIDVVSCAKDRTACLAVIKAATS